MRYCYIESKPIHPSQTLKEKNSEGKDVSLLAVGRKGRDYFRKKANIIGQWADILSKFDMTLAVSISNELIAPFIKEEYDELYLIYNQFVNVSVQRPTVVRLFPLPSIGQDVDVDAEQRLDYAYEPSEEVLLQKLLTMYVHVLIFRALLETSAGEKHPDTWKQKHQTCPLLAASSPVATVHNILSLYKNEVDNQKN